jgi:ketosteroid isomerase-like protein
VENRSVSRANVDLVRSSLEALGQGEFDAAFAVFDSEAEWHTADDEPDSQTYTGIPELRALMDQLADPWTNRFGDAVAFDGFIDRGDWVVAPWTARVHGKGSGIDIDLSETYAVLVEDGRIKRVEEYRTVEEALEAVGRLNRNDPAGGGAVP